MSAHPSTPAPSGDFTATAQKIREQLFVALFSDTLDSLGFRDQAFAPHIRPLDEELVLVGRARTGLYATSSISRRAKTLTNSRSR